MAEFDLASLTEGLAVDAATAGVKMPQGSFLDEKGQAKKIAEFGPPGSGKTFSFVDLLELGEKLFVVSSDPGGNGLATVKNELKRRKALALRKNIFYVDVRGYAEVLALWNAPYKFYGDALRKLDPTVAVWEGFSSFQVQSIDLYILPDELRPEKDSGTDPFVYWDKVRRATMRAHDAFLAANGEKRAWHHILTCHEAEAQEANPREKRKAQPDRPWIQGQASKMLEAAYDLIIQTSAEEEFNTETLSSELKYFYQIKAGSKESKVKSRGFDLPGKFEADMARVWKAMDVEEE